jgi:ribosomal protein S18 acetylase RimI-like enzyme
MWHFSSSVEPYGEKVWSLLSGQPELNTVGLTVIEGARAGFEWSQAEPTFGWWESADGEVTGAVSLTPPFGLLLNVVPDDAVADLAAGLRRRQVTLPGAHGEPELAARFAALWVDGAPITAEPRLHQRLYVLGELAPPPDPGGGVRVAGEGDYDLLVAWNEAFHEEVEAHAGRGEQFARLQIDQGTGLLWERAEGEAVSLACRRPAAAGVARIGPVYTPSAHRRRGYARAVTAACTQAAIDAGADRVVLFTDLANPTSNSIYQTIGYRPLADRTEYRFVETTA